MLPQIYCELNFVREIRRKCFCAPRQRGISSCVDALRETS